MKVRTKQLEKLSARVDAQREKIADSGRSSVDIEMMTAELEVLEKSLAEISAKREKLNIESRARPRIVREGAACVEGR